MKGKQKNITHNKFIQTNIHNMILKQKGDQRLNLFWIYLHHLHGSESSVPLSDSVCSAASWLPVWICTNTGLDYESESAHTKGKYVNGYMFWNWIQKVISRL